MVTMIAYASSVRGHVTCPAEHGYLHAWHDHNPQLEC